MQKLKQKANIVGGAAHSDPLNQNGITLIALIITIIVMLILVGVTINVALNGGLFTKASQASKQMQVQAEKEELLSSVVAAIGYDGKVVLADIELPTGWTGSNGTYTSPKGNTYTVDENGKIIQKDENKAESGTLVYGKIYRGPVTITASEGTNSYTIEMAFSKKYNRVFLTQSNTTISFEYNKDENIITMAELKMNLSEDGETISCNINVEGETVQGKLNLTEDIPFVTYAPEENTETDIYDGWYYNEELNSFIYAIVYTSDNDVNVEMCLDGNMYGYGGSQNVEKYINDVTNKLGITIIDSMHMRKDEYVYTLLEKLEI